MENRGLRTREKVRPQSQGFGLWQMNGKWCHFHREREARGDRRHLVLEDRILGDYKSSRWGCPENKDEGLAAGGLQSFEARYLSRGEFRG